MEFVTKLSAENSGAFTVVDSSPSHVLVLAASAVLLALTITVLIVLWRDRDRTLLEKTVWSVIALLFPVIGAAVVGVALLWHRARDAKRRRGPS